MKIRQDPSLGIKHLFGLVGSGPCLAIEGVAIVVLAMILAGCARPRPIKYYQITYPAAAPVSQEAIDTTLLVRSFEASHLYLDDRIVYGHDSPEMGAYEDQRWAEPPVEMLRDAIVRGFHSTGKFRGVYIARSDLIARYVLGGYLYDFKELDGATISARLSFEARLWDRKARTLVWSYSYSYDEPAAEKSVSAVATAMDKNVRRGVQSIEAGLTEYFKAHPPQQ